jgi:hypothetical protein
MPRVLRGMSHYEATLCCDTRVIVSATTPIRTMTRDAYSMTNRQSKAGA